MLSLGLTYYLCVFISLLYPTYASFKALETHYPDDDTQWLVYWTVFAFLSSIESVALFVLSWIPLYYEIKLAFFIWMMAPQTKGALVLYGRVIRPLLYKHASKLDPIFNRTNQALNSRVTGFAAGLVEKYGPEVAEKAMQAAAEQAAKLQATIAQQAAASR